MGGSLGPSTRGRARGEGWGGGLPPPGTSAVSKHQTGTVTKQTTGARWGGPGGVSPPGTAAVSKHQTGTVTRVLCDDWGDHPSAKKSRFFVPWEAGGPSPNQHASATPSLLNAWLQELSNSKEVKFVRMVFLIDDWGGLRVVPHR